MGKSSGKRRKLFGNFHYSMRFEMMFACFVVSVIPIVVMQTVFYNFSRSLLEQKVSKLLSNNLSYIDNNMESDIEYYKEILYRIDTDDKIVENELNFRKKGDFLRETSAINIRDLLASYADIRDEISGIVYVSNDMDSVFYDKKSISASNYLWDSYSDSEKKQLYARIHGNNAVILSDTRHYYYNNENRYLYTMGMRVWDVKTGEDLGIVLLFIDESHLQELCNINQSGETGGSVKSYSFIMDDADGNIISFADKSRIGRQIVKKKDGEYDIGQLLPAVPINQAGGVILNKKAVEGTSWQIVSVADKDSMFHETNALWKLTMGVTLLIIVVCCGLIVLFSDRFYKSIKEIVAEIKKAKRGDFSAHINLKRESELIFIGNEFNEMVARIFQLVENLKKQNDYILEISNKRREAEINAIVAQINPHFLYNTLDCINWMLIKDENYEASRMVGDLADILRYSIPKINEQVTVYDAVEWLKKYLYLHEVRFNNSFRAEFAVEEGAYSCKIYKLLLQPIIENSVLHGFKGLGPGLLLKISIALRGEDALHIEISDNGSGIPPEKLVHLFEEGSGKGIGLRNVRERLDIYYGAAASIQVESEPGAGTKVTLVIPAVR